MNNNSSVQRLEAMDHATYDAHLIRTWYPKYPWIGIKTDIDAAITPADLAENATHQLVSAIEASPLREKMRGQQLDTERTVIRFAAFEILSTSVQMVHLRQQKIDDAISIVRNDFISSLSLGVIRTNHKNSPLWEQGKKSADPARTMYEIDISRSKWDQKFLENLAGGNLKNRFETGPMRDFLANNVPFLASLDRSGIDVHYEDFRADLLRFANSNEFLEDHHRTRILNQTFEAWVAHDAENRAQLEKAERMLKVPFYRMRRMQELADVSPSIISEQIAHRGQRASGNAEKRLAFLLDLESIDPRIAKPDSKVMEPESLPMVIRYIDELLEKPQSQNELRAHIKPLMSVLEWQTMDAMQRILTEREADAEDDAAIEQAIGDARNIQRALLKIQEKASLHPSEHPALGLIAIALASQDSQTTTTRLRSLL